MEIVNIAAYKFVGIPDAASWRPIVKERCEQIGVMGNILLSQEGINLFVAGERGPVDQFLQYLKGDPFFAGRFSDIPVKESISDHQPFRRIVVRVKDEIITMKHPMIDPTAERAPAVEPKTLKVWLDQGHDDNGREIVLLDTRNDYEVQIGTFEGALHFGIDKFSEFPDAIRRTTGDTKEQLQNKTIVSFCTGGIRCEKAALFLQEPAVGLANVYQLDGGILRYFEEVGDAHYKGECFVFDRRVALDAKLQETTHEYEVTAPAGRNADYLRWKAGQLRK
jgi:UPF0176 protein